MEVVGIGIEIWHGLLTRRLNSIDILQDSEMWKSFFISHDYLCEYCTPPTHIAFFRVGLIHALRFSFPLCCAIHSFALIPSSSSSPAGGIPSPFNVFNRQSSLGLTKYTILYLGHLPCSPGAGETLCRPEHSTPFVNFTAASLIPKYQYQQHPVNDRRIGIINSPKINNRTPSLRLHPQPRPLRILRIRIIKR